uniref:Variant surface glycoprotein 1968 n=1 Tax=Trypanosoma brucei TaxID=5691 RepID=M4SWR5_9TRYP|nr:variant surface glycoprotein 1968 [Trypanosoma brucei]
MWHVTILLLTLSQRSTAQPTKAAAMAVETLCDDAAYLEQLRTGMELQLTTSGQRLHDLQTEAEEMELAAAATADKKAKRVYYALEAITRARAARQSADINSTKAVMKASLRTLTQRLAQLQLLYTIYPADRPKTAATAKTTETPGIFGATTETCVITTTADNADFAQCTTQSSQKAALKNAYAELSRETHIKATGDEMFKRRSIKITAAAKSTISSAMNTVDKDQCQGSSGVLTSTTNGIGATVEFANSADATLTNVQITPQTSGGKCGDSDPDKDKATVSQAGLAYAICKVRNLKINLQETVKTTTKANLETDPDAPTILAASSRGPEGPSSKPLPY